MKSTQNKIPYNCFYLWKAKYDPKELLVSCFVKRCDYERGETMLWRQAPTGELQEYTPREPINFARIQPAAEALAQLVLNNEDCIYLAINHRPPTSCRITYKNTAGAVELEYKDPTQKNLWTLTGPVLPHTRVPPEYERFYEGAVIKLAQEMFCAPREHGRELL